MYHRGMNWGEYLTHRDFTDEIVGALDQQTTAINRQTFATALTGAFQGWVELRKTKVLADGFDALAQNQEYTNSILSSGFGALIANQQDMARLVHQDMGAISQQLAQVHGGLNQLQSRFEWWMGELVWKLESQDQTLKSILEVMQAPLDTQAKELRRRAETAYQHGWYDEALADLLESERKNYQDFAIHQMIGNIYLYKQQPANLEAARDYYAKAGKYATPKSPYHAALGYIHAGLACYLHRNDDEAVKFARQATSIYPEMTEAWYNLAKFAAVAGNATIAISSLERIIKQDRFYAVKVRADADFVTLEHEIAALMSKLSREVKQQAETLWSSLKQQLQAQFLPDKIKAKVAEYDQAIQQPYQQGTYFGYLDALAKIGELQSYMQGLRLTELGQLRQQVSQKCSQLRATAKGTLKNGEWLTRFEASLSQVETSAQHSMYDECLKVVKEATQCDQALAKQQQSEQEYQKKLARYEQLKQEYPTPQKSVQELEQAREIQLQEWKQNSCCIDCGESLGFMNRLRGIDKCSECSKKIKKKQYQTTRTNTFSDWLDSVSEPLPDKKAEEQLYNRRKRNSKNPTIWDSPNWELLNLERELGIGAK